MIDNDFFLSYKPLIIHVAKQYRGAGLDMEDLIQEGIIGLIHAAENFKEDKNIKFSTYATYWIKQSIDKAVSKYGRPIRLPANVYDNVRKVRKISRILETEGHDLDPSDIAARTGLTLEEVQIAIELDAGMSSLDEEKEEDVPLGDKIPSATFVDPYENISDEDTGQILERVLMTLSNREAEVLKLRFGIGEESPKTLEEIGAILNISKQRVSQIEDKAIHKLRNPARKKILIEALYD